MDEIKKYMVSIGIALGLIILFSFFINLLNYFDILSSSAYKIILVLLNTVSIILASFILGKKSNEKGYLKGIKFGLIITIIMFIISYLAFDTSISTITILYYVILIIASIIGSVFGINKNENKW